MGDQIQRNSIAKDADQMQGHVFPEDCWRPSEPKENQAGRSRGGAQHSSENGDNNGETWEGDRRKLPVLSLTVNLVNKGYCCWIGQWIILGCPRGGDYCVQ